MIHFSIVFLCGFCMEGFRVEVKLPNDNFTQIHGLDPAKKWKNMLSQLMSIPKLIDKEFEQN